MYSLSTSCVRAMSSELKCVANFATNLTAPPRRHREASQMSLGALTNPPVHWKPSLQQNERLHSSAASIAGSLHCTIGIVPAEGTVYAGNSEFASSILFRDQCGALDCLEPARLALLIGNQGYTAKVGPLRNPRNDVNLIEASLKQIGFKVTVLKDASYKTMDSGLKRYVTEVRRAGRGVLSFFYYSGHGVANPETQINYLIPIDVTDADDDKVWFELFQQNTIIDLLSKQAPNATHYVVFDAAATRTQYHGLGGQGAGHGQGLRSNSGHVRAADSLCHRTEEDCVGRGRWRHPMPKYWPKN